ncbi:MAG: phosphate-starvation-inducible PsiE family protein [Desulfobacterales bacterium]|nr:phosphate-starvation-inducible PsiE family protein [Desulfobacterales bacterium]
MEQKSLFWAERAERGIYWTVGIVLILTAAIYLVFTVWEGFSLYMAGHFASATIKLFDRSLLTLMIAQIVYTTLNFLKVGVLQVEPVLVVGIIAVVRRILVLTAVVSGTAKEMGASMSFRESMIELGLLSLTVLVLAVSVYLVRKNTVIETSQEKTPADISKT